MDTHADTTAGGPGVYVTAWTQQHVTVHSFSQQLQSLQKVPIVSFAVAYDDPVEMKVYVLFFHQALYIQQLDHTLVCPAQVRLNGITVNDTPLSSIHPNQRRATDHSIIDEYTGLHIPLN